MNLSRIARQIAINFRDMVVFGPGVIRRHWKRHGADPVMPVRVRDIGAVYIRAGDSDICALRQVFIDSEYDLSHPEALGARIQARYQQLMASGQVPIIADIGANIGVASLWFNARFPEAAIVAVEPDPGNAAMLRRNVAGREKITVVEAAIGSEPGFVALDAGGQGWTVQTRRAETGVAVVTVDDALKASQGDTAFIVKIDIEGFESDLFASNLDWISKAHVVIIEPHDWMMPGKMTSLPFQKAMAAHAFEIYIRRENLLYARV